MNRLLVGTKSKTKCRFSDMIIASLAIVGGCEVLTVDPHFQHVPGFRSSTT